MVFRRAAKSARVTRESISSSGPDGAPSSGRSSTTDDTTSGAGQKLPGCRSPFMSIRKHDPHRIENDE